FFRQTRPTSVRREVFRSCAIKKPTGDQRAWEALGAHRYFQEEAGGFNVLTQEAPKGPLKGMVFVGHDSHCPRKDRHDPGAGEFNGAASQARAAIVAQCS